MLVENRPLHQKQGDRGCSRRWNQAAAALFLVLVATVGYGGADDDGATEANGNQGGQKNQAQRTEKKDLPTVGRARRKERLRYSGRTFEQWRDQLLDDLDPNTIVQAMQPITAFGRTGYATEAVAALSEVMLADGPVDDGGIVAVQAAGALARIGAEAAPALIEGLADRRPAVRGACAGAVAQLGAAGQGATDALVKLLADDVENIRHVAAASLIVLAGDNDELRTTFERLAKSDDAEIRKAFVFNLGSHPPKGDWWVDLFLQLADDEDINIRVAVGNALATHAPPERRVILALEDLLGADDENVSSNTLSAVLHAAKPAMLVAVLTDAFEHPLLWNRFSRQPMELQIAINRLGRAPDQAAATVPLLIGIIGLKRPPFDMTEVHAAMDALGRIGPDAKLAIPVLARWVTGDYPGDETERKHAYRALKKIRGEDMAEAK